MMSSGETFDYGYTSCLHLYQMKFTLCLQLNRALNRALRHFANDACQIAPVELNCKLTKYRLRQSFVIKKAFA